MIPVHQEDRGVPIQRIVKLTIRPDAVAEFEALFKEIVRTIMRQPGCEHVELLRNLDADHAHVFFTHSYWTSEDALEDYRHSEVFGTIWPRTKLLFAAPAEAWTMVMND